MKKVIYSLILLCSFIWVSNVDPAIYNMSKSNDMRELSKNLTDTQLFALAMFGETRGESDTGKIAMGTVVLERADITTSKNPIREVLLKRKAFSCFNSKRNKNLRLMKKYALNWNIYYKKSEELKKCFLISSGMVDKTIPRNIFLRGVTHYQKIGTNSYWSKTMTKLIVIDNHEFYLDNLRKDNKWMVLAKL